MIFIYLISCLVNVKSKVSYIIITFLLSFLIGKIYCQDEIFVFDIIGEKEGLPNNYVNKFLQDDQGFIWITTFDGLVKYDGINFQEFRYNRLDKKSISENILSSIHQDKSRNLWIITSSADINIKLADTDSFISNEKLSFPRLNANNITSLLPIDNGDVWISGDKGIEVIQVKGQSFSYLDEVCFEKLAQESFSQLNVIFQDKKQRIWLGGHNGLYLINDPKCPNPLKINSKKVIDINEDRTGIIWVATSGEKDRIYRFNEAIKSLEPEKSITSDSKSGNIGICFDFDNRLWYSEFGRQLNIYDLANDSMIMRSEENSNLRGKQFFRAPFCDNNGNIWIGENGILKFNYPKGFHNLYYPDTDSRSNSFVDYDGTFLWIGFKEAGILRINPLDNKSEFIDFSSKSKLDPGLITKLIKIDDQRRLLAGFGNIYQYNILNNDLQSFKLSGTNRAMIKDSKSRIWIGGLSGLHLFEVDKGITHSYKIPDKNQSQRQFIQALAEDSNQKIWVGSGTLGFAYFDELNNSLLKVETKDVNGQVIEFKNINDLCYDEQHELIWIGTDAGLLKYHIEDDYIEIFDVNNGIENDYIQAVLLDNEGQLWVSSNSGLAFLDQFTKTFIKYSTKDGLANSVYYNRSKTKLPDGQLFFGGQYGVDYFNPSEIRKNPSPPQVACTFFSINGEVMPVPSLDDLKKGFMLNHSDNYLELSFSANHFSSAESNRFYYKFQETHEKWIELESNPKVVLPNLSVGNYKLMIKAESYDGIPIEENLIIPIRITPPIYLKPWFIILFTFLTLGGAIYFIRKREQNIKAKEEIKLKLNKKINDLEKRALLAQMNPHFVFNCLNSIQHFMYSKDIENAMNYLTKFSRIIRSVMNFSTQERISIQEEIEFIENYIELEQMRFSEKFTYEINIDPSIDIYSGDIPPFFIQPQVENSIKHGLIGKSQKKGHITINMDKVQDHLKIQIIDNGIGRSNSITQQNKNINENGRGITLTDERLEHLNSEKNYQQMKIEDLKDNEGLASGTKVEFILPFD